MRHLHCSWKAPAEGLRHGVVQPFSDQSVPVRADRVHALLGHVWSPGKTVRAGLEQQRLRARLCEAMVMERELLVGGILGGSCSHPLKRGSGARAASAALPQLRSNQLG